MEPDNTEATYWVAEYPNLTKVLSEVSGRTLVEVWEELAFIAGDYMNMSDDDVLTTFMNERVR